jgi:hypothetical protein
MKTEWEQDLYDCAKAFLMSLFDTPHHETQPSEHVIHAAMTILSGKEWKPTEGCFVLNDVEITTPDKEIGLQQLREAVHEHRIL